MKAKVWMMALAIVGGLVFTSCDKEDEMNDMAPAAAAPSSNNDGNVDQPGDVDDAPRPGGDAGAASR